MNKNALKGVMATNGFNNLKLAEILGISAQSVSKKINQRGSEFNLNEVSKIKKIFQLNDEQLVNIFFDE